MANLGAIARGSTPVERGTSPTVTPLRAAGAIGLLAKRSMSMTIGAAQRSANAHPGTYVGSPTLGALGLVGTSHRGMAARFSGSTTQTATSPVGVVPTADRSFFTWVYLTAVSGSAHAINLLGQTYVDKHAFLYAQNTGGTTVIGRFGVHDASTTSFADGAAITLGAWHLVVGTYSASDSKPRIYVDSASSVVAGAALAIGADASAYVWSGNWATTDDGYLGPRGVVSRALSGSEIDALAAATTPASFLAWAAGTPGVTAIWMGDDASGATLKALIGPNGTYSGGPTLAAAASPVQAWDTTGAGPAYSGTGFLFDGVTPTHGTVPAAGIVTAARTFVGWINASSDTDMIYYNVNSSAPYMRKYSNGSAMMSWMDAGGVQRNIVTPNHVVDPNTGWHLVVGWHDGTTTSGIDVDGVNVVTSALYTSRAEINSARKFGSFSAIGSNYMMNGGMGPQAEWARCLTAAERLSLWQARTGGWLGRAMELSPVGLWPLDDQYDGLIRSLAGPTGSWTVGAPGPGMAGPCPAISAGSSAVTFNGSSQYVSVPDSAPFRFAGLAPFMAFAVVSHTPDATGRVIMACTGASNYGWWISSYTGGVTIARNSSAGVDYCTIATPISGTTSDILAWYDGANMRLWVNGAERSGGAVASVRVIPAGGTFAVARCGISTSIDFNGTVDEPAVFGYCASDPAAFAASLHAARLSGSLGSVLSAAAPTGWWPFDETAGTTALDATPVAGIIDHGALADRSTVAINDDAWVASLGVSTGQFAMDEPMLYSRPLTPADVSALYAAGRDGSWSTVVPTTGPLAWWRFGEPSGATAVDATTDVLHGQPSLLGSGYSVALSGSKQYIQNAAVPGNGATVTLASVIQTTSMASAGRIVSWRDLAYGGVELYLSNGALVGYAGTDTGPHSVIGVGTGPLVNDGKPHLVAVSVDVPGFLMTLYVDGKVTNTFSLAALGGHSLGQSHVLTVGQYYDNTTQAALDGLFDDTLFFGRALSATEHAALNAARSGGWATAVMALFPTVWWTFDETSGPFSDWSSEPDSDTAVSFDGSTEYVNTPITPAFAYGRQPFSLSAWINVTADATSRRIFSSEAGSGVSGLFMYYNSSYVYMRRCEAVATDIAYAPYPGPGWHLITATYDGSTLAIYIDGVLGSGASASVSSTKVITPGTNLRIAMLGYTAGGYGPIGLLDEPAVWSRGLSAAEVAAQYAASISPTAWATQMNALRPMAWWRLGEPSGTTAVDAHVAGLGGDGSVVGDFDGALITDGSERVDWPLPDMGTSFTIIGRFRRSMPGSGQLEWLFDAGDQKASLYVGADDCVRFAKSNAQPIVKSGTQITDTGWHSIIAIHDAGTGLRDLYIDYSNAGNVTYPATVGTGAGTAALAPLPTAHDLTLTGAPTLNVTSLITGDTNTAMTFSGSSQYGSPTDSSPFRFDGAEPFMVWLVEDHTWDAQQRTPIGCVNASGYGWYLYLGTGAAAFTRRDASGYDYVFGTVLSGSPTTDWLLWFDGTQMRMYQDGVLKGPTASTNSMPSDSSFTIGRRGVVAGPGASDFAGTIDEPAVFGYADADPATVAADLHAGRLDGTLRARIMARSPLAYWRLGERSGTVAYDEIGRASNRVVGGVDEWSIVKRAITASEVQSLAGIDASGSSAAYDRLVFAVDNSSVAAQNVLAVRVPLGESDGFFDASLYGGAFGANDRYLNYGTTGWKYKIVAHGDEQGFEDPGHYDADWADGATPFGSIGTSAILADTATQVPPNKDLLVRRRIELLGGTPAIQTPTGENTPDTPLFDTTMLDSFLEVALDQILTPSEKSAVVQRYDGILAEKTGVDAQADYYAISRSGYDASVTALTAYLATLTDPVMWNDPAGNTTIIGPDFRDAFTAVEAAKQSILSAIANTTTSWFDDIASDNVLSPNEKSIIIRENTVLTTEKTGIDNQATAFGITTAKTAYDDALTHPTTGLAHYLSTLTTPVHWDDVSGNTTIDGPTFRTKFAAVYTAKTALLNAISAANKALADSKAAVYVQTTAPSGTFGTNDVWYDSDDGNKPYRWNGTSWVTIQDTAALDQLVIIGSDAWLSKGEKPAVILDKQKLDDEHVGLDTQASNFGIGQPKTDYDNAYAALGTYLTTTVGSSWNNTTVDTAIPAPTSNWQIKWAAVYSTRQALLAAIYAAAKSIADSKAAVFVQTTAPTGTFGTNDLWYDSDDGFHQYRWSGSAWVTVQDTAALDQLVIISSDAWLSKGEKPAAILAMKALDDEHLGLDTAASNFGIGQPKTDYDNAYAALGTYLNTTLGATWNNTAVDTAIPAPTSNWQIKWALVYTTRQALLTAMADTSRVRLDDIASDAILTAGEKPAVIREKAAIDAEKTTLDAQADAYLVTSGEKATYDAAVTALTTYLGTTLNASGPKNWNDTTGNTTIPAPTSNFAAAFNLVYTTRRDLTTKITANAKAGIIGTSSLDSTIPKAPTIGTLASDAVSTDPGDNVVRLIVPVTQPTQNVDNSAISDLDGTWVEITGDYTGSSGSEVPVWTSAIRQFIGAGQTQAVFVGVRGYSLYWARAISQDKSRNSGSYSAVAGPKTTAKDPVSPSVPNGLTAVPIATGLVCKWSLPPDGDLDVIELGWTPDLSGAPDAQKWQSVNVRSSVTIISGLAAQSIYWIRARSIDLSGNMSAYTANQSFTVGAISPDDFGANRITATQIDTSTILADMIQGGTFKARPGGAGFAQGFLVQGSTGTVLGSWDGSGFIIRDPAFPTLRYAKINAGSVSITADGGATWAVQMTPDGFRGESVKLGALPGGHNVVANSGFELAPTVAVVPVAWDVSADWTGTSVSNDNVTVGTDDLTSTIAY